MNLASHSSPTALPPYLRPGPIALVIMGGAVGTAIRAWAESSFPTPAGGFPWVTFIINVSGALLLGVLLELIALLGHRRTGIMRLRLALGTGLLGGYTTYSSFVVESVQLGIDGHFVTAMIYDAASLSAGFLAALVAVVVLRRLTRSIRERSAGGHA